VGLFTATFLEALPYAATVHIGFNTIFGTAFGIVYTRFYDVIPGKGIKKGLVYALILYLAQDLWPASYYLANGNFPASSGFLFSGILVSATYGLLQGALYQGPKHLGETEDSITRGIIVGAIAGIIGGIMAFALQFMNINIMGMSYYWYQFMAQVRPVTSIINLAAIEIVLMTVWGAVFSALFVLFYVRVPGRGIMKGLCFGLILCLLCVVRTFSWGIPYAAIRNTLAMSIVIYSLMFITYGLVLGALYRKPSD